MQRIILITLGLGALGFACGCNVQRSEAVSDKSTVDRAALANAIHPKDVENKPEMQTHKAMFGAGCFWGVEQKFRSTEGVVRTAVGYAGGSVDNPTYKQVCSDTTGHAEVVLVEYDPRKVSYEELLEVFWTSHDPTQVNRQGPDFGSQYRSAIFVYDEAQMEAAQQSKAALADSGRFDRKIATEITPAKTFWRAEEYHQQYLEKRGMKSCATTIEG